MKIPTEIPDEIPEIEIPESIVQAAKNVIVDIGTNKLFNQNDVTESWPDEDKEWLDDASDTISFSGIIQHFLPKGINITIHGYDDYELEEENS